MDYYLIVKKIHMTMAALSLLGFILRGFWLLTNNNKLQAKLSKILPHIIDTLLLVSAIYMLVASQVNPLAVNWIMAKIVLLVLYIAAGTIALKKAKTQSTKVIALLVSLSFICGIFAIAAVKPALAFF